MRDKTLYEIYATLPASTPREEKMRIVRKAREHMIATRQRELAARAMDHDEREAREADEYRRSR